MSKTYIFETHLNKWKTQSMGYNASINEICWSSDFWGYDEFLNMTVTVCGFHSFISLILFITFSFAFMRASAICIRWWIVPFNYFSLSLFDHWLISSIIDLRCTVWGGFIDRSGWVSAFWWPSSLLTRKLTVHSSKCFQPPAFPYMLPIAGC